MKLKVKDIEPNPFRRMDRYPIDRAKIEQLKRSIKETGFWDNVLARPHPDKKGKYQIAYGHHRHLTIKELGIKEIDIPVKEIDDAMMLRIMAEENLHYTSSPAVINETVFAAKAFLNAELAKYTTWDQAKKVPIFRHLFTGVNARTRKPIDNPKASFGQAKGAQGIGGDFVFKFLGGNWKFWMVEDALATLNDPQISREAVETFKSPSHAHEFRRAVKNAQGNGTTVTKAQQKRVAKHVAAEVESESLRAKDVVIRTSKALGVELKKKKAIVPQSLDKYVRKLTHEMSEITTGTQQIQGKLGNIQDDVVYSDYVLALHDLLKALNQVIAEHRKQGVRKCLRRASTETRLIGGH